MKIGINASFLRNQSSGIGQVTINFIKKLTEFSISNSQFPIKDWEFILYLEEDTDLKLPKNFKKVIKLPLWRRDDLVRAIWWQKRTLPKLAQQDGCDVFISLYQCATILPKRIKHVMVVHDVLLEFFPEYLNNARKRYFWKLTKQAIARADQIVSVSRRTEKDLIQQLGLAAEKIAVAPIAAAPSFDKLPSERKVMQVLKKYGLTRGYIYHGGGLEKRKNTKQLLLAYKRLLHLNKKLGLVEKIPPLVVSGKLLPQLAPLVFDLEKAVRESNLSNQVKILGFVPDADLPGLYAGAQFFVYPSKYEGFGLPPLEAMKMGTPVICAKTSSLPEVCRDAALYFNPDDTDDLVMVMRNLLLNSGLRQKMAERGKMRSAQFDWHKFSEKILVYIEEFKAQ